MEQVHLTQLLAATRGTAPGLEEADASFERVCTDTRTLREGDVFWALRGPNHNGHDFVEAALRQGAAWCMVEPRQGTDAGKRLVYVDNTLKALGDFARWYRHQHEALVIGVTGSVGKTTTREMIFAALSARYTGTRSRNNFNNEVGLPLSLLEIDSEHEFAVLEMGASRVGDIRTLCETACPEVGVLTQIGPAHLDTFGNIEQVLRAKGELLESLPKHGFAVVGGDDERMRPLASRAVCSTIFVGEKSGNQVRATDVEVGLQKLRFSVDRKRYEVPATGRHHLLSALCAVAVAREIGLEAGAIAAGLQKFAGEPGRCQAVVCGPWTVIDDTYNANPTSMNAACRCLADWPGNVRKLLVVGDMLELGADAARFHRELGADAARMQIDHLLAFGEQSKNVVNGARQAGMAACRLADCQDLESIGIVLDCWLEAGDVVLVKGSRGMRMERIVELIKHRADHKNNAPKPTRAVA